MNKIKLSILGFLGFSVFVFLFSSNMTIAKEIYITKSFFEKYIKAKPRRGYWGSGFASSYLIEKGSPKRKYAPENLFDDKVETSWVEGKKGDGIGEHVIINLGDKDYDRSNPRNPMKLKLTIVNGYAKNKYLFHANNRVKKLKVLIYEAQFYLAMSGPWLANRPKLNDTIILNLKDTLEPQEFILTIYNKMKPVTKPYKAKYPKFWFIGKLIIDDVYRGTKFRDTCLSEIKIRFAGEKYRY